MAAILEQPAIEKIVTHLGLQALQAAGTVNSSPLERPDVLDRGDQLPPGFQDRDKAA